MTLRGRLTLMSALVVGAVLVLAAVTCFLVMRNELRSQVDEALQNQAALVRRLRSIPRPAGAGARLRLPAPPKRAGGPAPYAQFLTRSGVVRRPPGNADRLPVDALDRAVAHGDAGETIRDRRAGGIHVRVMTIPLGSAGAVQLGRSLESTDTALRRLRIVLALLVAVGTLVAALVSRLFARRVLAPIAELTAATGHIEATGDLDRRVQAGGSDEVGRLAARFNAMLERLQGMHDALAASTETQRHLVADASHELRTPVASLRTNIEVLRASPDLPPGERDELLADLVDQVEELSTIMNDLIELARGDQPPQRPEDLNLAELLEESLERSRLHAPTTRFRATSIEPWPMSGSPERLSRALNNVLDNAVKFSPPGSTVTVELRDGRLTVTDQGPGVPDDELTQIFDRFYRGRTSAPYHGSGLGLAIVKQVVESHHGTARATRASPLGGLTICLTFPDSS